MTHRETFSIPTVFEVIPQSSLPDAPHAQTSPNASGHGAATSSPAAPLDPEVNRDMRWCAKCGGSQVFVDVYEVESGRIGFCFGCGDEKFVPFTRQTEAS